MKLLVLYIAAILAAQGLVFLFLWWAHLRFWRWRLEVQHHYDHFEEIALPDGGAIELRRLDAHAATGARGRVSPVPVLLVHGLAMNHRNHDTIAGASFARYLQAQGRDVWLLRLRSGRSRPSLFSSARSHFAAMVKHDLPHAVQRVLSHTREPQLDLAVFSMGGMLLYAGLDRTLDARLVRRVAVFASPAKVRPLGLMGLSRYLPAPLAPSVPLRLLMRTLAFAPRWVSHLLWRRLYNPNNVERRIERQMLWNVWEDIPGRLGNDFVRWSGAGGEITVDGEPVLAGLAHVRIPVCFFAGARDWLAPAWTVRTGYEAWGSATSHVEKHFVVLGTESGTRHDYGHCDIAFGKHAEEEVFAPAAMFLATGAFRTTYAPAPLPAVDASAAPAA